MANPMEPYKREGRKGWYVDLGYVKHPDGSKRRHRGLKCEGRTKEEARSWAYQERALIATHGDRKQPKEEPPTVDELFPLYLERTEKVGGRRGKAGAHWLERQRSAYCGLGGKAGWLRPRFGELPVTKVDSKKLDRLVMDMHEAGRSPKTIIHTLQVMRGILNLAVRHKHLGTLPDFPDIQDSRPARKAFTFEEAARALDCARRAADRRGYVLLLLGFHAGLYQEEIMGLERSDVDFEAGCLRVRRSALNSGEVKPPKTENRVRDIPLTPMLEDALRDHLRTVPVGVKFLFFRKHPGGVRRVKKDSLRWPVRAALKRAGLTSEEPYRRMRRTFCTEATQRVPEVLVTRWMGHADRTVTNRHYVADWPMEIQRQCIARLEQPVTEAFLGATREPAQVVQIASVGVVRK